jgi:Metal binding domain of Ada
MSFLQFSKLMLEHKKFTPQEIRQQIKSKQITLGGNRNLKIFGTLSCKSGKKMLQKNRVFFENEADATQNGYRPCGHCMRAEFQAWKLKNLT